MPPRNTESLEDRTRKVTIERFPLDSTIARALISALDYETSALYPDFDSANDPLQSRRVTRSGKVYKAIPARERVVENRQPVKDDLKEVLKAIAAEARTDLHLHVAFDVTDCGQYEAHTNNDSELESSRHYDLSKRVPIGCVGVQLRPHFPHFEEQPGTSRVKRSMSIEYAEVRKVYVVPSFRGKKVCVVDGASSSTQTSQERVATSLLKKVVDYAEQSLGVDVLVLEVGFRQVAAMRLYERLGWGRRLAYGDYVGDEVENGGVSICYEKELTRRS